MAFRLAAGDADSPTTTNTISTAATTTTTTEGGSICIELQFTGPQPIEGPAGLLCNLLQATFVAARPVQLNRGRKRKVRPGGFSEAPSSPFSFTPIAETSDGPYSYVGATRHSANKTTKSNASTPSTTSFRNHPDTSNGSGGAAAVAAAAAAARKSRAIEYDSDTPSTASSATSSSSNFHDVHDDLLQEDGGASVKTFADPDDRPSSPEQPSSDGCVADQDMFTALHLGGDDSLALEFFSAPVDPNVATTATAGSPASSHLERSFSEMTVAGDAFPKWDDVIRRVESPSSSSSSGSGAGNRPPSPLEHFGESPATAAASTHTEPPPAPTPGLDRGVSYDECMVSMMSQEEAVLLLADATTATAATTATVAAAAAEAAARGGVVVSEDGLWDGAPDEADALFCPPALGRHSSSSWGLDSADAATAVVVEDNEEDAVRQRVSSIVPDQPVGATSTGNPQQQEQEQPTGWYGDERHCTKISAAAAAAAGRITLPLEGDGIKFGWFEEERDFDGRSTTRGPPVASTSSFPPPAAEAATASSSSSPLDSQCQLAFLGLESAGRELRDLVIRAHFFVDPTAKVEKVVSPLTVDGDAASGRGGRVNVTVPYPSIRDIWPEVYESANIRVIEVDMTVEVRSRDGKLVYTGPMLKVTYRRPITRALGATAVPMLRQISHSSRSEDADSGLRGA